ncbi:dCTP deaminase [Candidatus Sumerlaeota bacterium]|nr:dCTP deaminase [Candidatus Sumerlaeota bacterium]
MILSGIEIQKKITDKSIVIDPYFEDRLNPNSYNLTLHGELGVYEDAVLDMKKKPTLRTFEIPPEGYELQPGRLYLGRTAEFTETHGFVPMLEGRSSIGRLGMFVHVTAGFGDVGFCGFWTLEIAAIQPIRIYAGVEICQIFYHQISGEFVAYKSRKYQHNRGLQPSLLYKDFSDGKE